ncbi:MAG TPA: DUF4198 domain-containing protein [Gemmatimonadaceae bacterium]|nr:DUF4198 domain-containing protein [Gemmatimonadaceae bacterium]
MIQRSRYPIAVAVMLLAATALEAHDLFLRLDSFYVMPNSTASIRALNGTFSSSENSVTTDRLRDLSVVSPSGRQHPDTAMWSSKGDTSVFTLKTGASGTYVVGASLKPREITLKAADFNTYLSEDGIPDVLAARRNKGELGKDATERYAKHIKAIVQVGSARTQEFSTELGYPAEIVPLENPYSLKRGAALRVRTLVDGKPAANQLVVTGGRTAGHKRQPERRVRSDASGIARVRIAGPGQWYVKFISMTPYQGAEKIDYESKWATLTFEIR